MDDDSALAYTGPATAELPSEVYAASEVGGFAVACDLEGPGVSSAWEPAPVQILVVVANTQVRDLRTEVEKGSM
ncbi:hypothetical protein JTE90_017336 [Oedothorax gibbosus]|uniref:Uncharacterized protein n=1 Tax=Oedothorax gibbosus TaxID=931172 RepID=A0AAV6TF34_9ARAC|nr:hypothetical protein JTE90_017336 [Oedothorax gibbosus]